MRVLLSVWLCDHGLHPSVSATVDITCQSTYESQLARDRGAGRFLDSQSRLPRHSSGAPFFAYKTYDPGAYLSLFTFALALFLPSVLSDSSLPARLALAARPSALLCLSGPLTSAQHPSNGQVPPQYLVFLLPVTCTRAEPCPCLARAHLDLCFPTIAATTTTTTTTIQGRTSTTTSATVEKPRPGFSSFLKWSSITQSLGFHMSTPDWPNYKSAPPWTRCQTACSKNRGIAAG